MQKKFIALAVASLVSGAAFAQTNVTVYGVGDVSFEGASATGATSFATGANTLANPGLTAAQQAVQSNIGNRARVQSNSSLLGFKGSEALGNGLTAVFQIETGVNFNQTQNANQTGVTPPGTGIANGLFTGARDTYVGVAGGFGTVIGGWISTLYRSQNAAFDVVPGSAGAGNNNGVFAKANGNVNLAFRTNAIAYISPTFSGFNGGIAYVPNSFNSQDTTTGALANTVRIPGNLQGLTLANPSAIPANNQVNPYGWNVALNYANGGAKVSYSYLGLNDVGIGSGSSEKHNANLLSGLYAFGQGTTVSAQWQNFNGKISLGSAAGVNDLTLKRNSYFLGVKHVMGANEFAASYQNAASTSGSLMTTLGNTYNPVLGSNIGNNNTGAQQFTLRYGYNFSKRTQAYALYTKISNNSNAAFDLNSSNGNGSVNSALGADPQVYGVGLRHSF
ncbi:porin [Propionivibrio sp.]|uniref:porin n=1 Tax=Propionivibrio sp. TaxID=2212460 RepID=UPI003BF0991A